MEERTRGDEGEKKARKTSLHEDITMVLYCLPRN